MSKLRFPQGLDAAGFLSLYWERRPLLMRGALCGFDCGLSPDELAGLACEPGAEARVVLEKDGERPWEVRYGPFREEAFRHLPESHWTLLVQDADKWLPQVAALLDHFSFLPNWRVDDVMVSYAADQGSVGPHFDEYDVFLYQARGRRRWRIHTRPVSEENVVADSELRLLPEFEAEEEWLLEPGDLLYLPPRVAHWGIAEGECMTCSVGFRAPSWGELASGWCQYVIDECLPRGYYRDPPRTQPPQATGEIPADAVAPIREIFRSGFDLERGALRRWFGRFVTEPKPELGVEPLHVPVAPEVFLLEYRERSLLRRDLQSRIAFTLDVEGHDYLYANGQEFPVDGVDKGLLRALTQRRELHYGYLSAWLDEPAAVDLLTTLYNQGHLVFDHD